MARIWACQHSSLRLRIVDAVERSETDREQTAVPRPTVGIATGRQPDLEPHVPHVQSEGPITRRTCGIYRDAEIDVGLVMVCHPPHRAFELVDVVAMACDRVERTAW